MATILVAMLTLKLRFSHQLVSSDRRLRAIAAADVLLQQWWADPTKFPVNRSGSVSQASQLEWRTHLVSNDVAAQLNLRVIRLDILADANVVMSVELMLPREPRHAK
jgi:hypothetical protein